jgi:GNAT superfamily N-acetyltransferase
MFETALEITEEPISRNDMPGTRFKVAGGGYDGGSHIDVVESKWSPTKYSIIEFLTDPKSRGTGIGGKLLDAAINKYRNEISAACSSKESLTMVYNRGFRGLGDNKEKSLAELEVVRQEYSSVTLTSENI